MKKLIILLSLSALAGCSTSLIQEDKLQIRSDMARIKFDQLYREQLKHNRGGHH